MEDEAGDGVGLDHPAEEFPRSQEVFLAGKLGQIARAHPYGKRLDAPGGFVAAMTPQVTHTALYPGRAG
ncbi:MAG: hypothetical protein HBSAPP03_18680 [Phycisphaerae bacterium]|nr:MAG: hypothetical protein HBSAPP03_18680 [Phycisphaerae bacterium]